MVLLSLTISERSVNQLLEIPFTGFFRISDLGKPLMASSSPSIRLKDTVLIAEGLETGIRISGNSKNLSLIMLSIVAVVMPVFLDCELDPFSPMRKKGRKSFFLKYFPSEPISGPPEGNLHFMEA